MAAVITASSAARCGDQSIHAELHDQQDAEIDGRSGMEEGGFLLSRSLRSLFSDRSPGLTDNAGYFHYESGRSRGDFHAREYPRTFPNYDGRRMLRHSIYTACYTASARMGTRFGLEGSYKVMRLESAYAYDFLGHVYSAQQIGLILMSLNRWAGYSERESRIYGAWYGAFGMLTLMEVLNGFMPNVRFDPLDLPGNFIGSWLASGASGLPERYPRLKRLSLQIGYKSVDRILRSGESNNILGNVWHDYPNGRWGMGYDVGPLKRPWFTLFGTYTITSMNVATMKNRFGMGIELNAIGWMAPVITRFPGGSTFMRAYDWLNGRVMIPYLYFQLFHFDVDPWSGRNPFAE
jgi:hypothetical protein